MSITLNSIKYSRKFNLGNYESEEIGVEAFIQGEETPKQCLAHLMDFVNSRGQADFAVTQVKKADGPVEIKAAEETTTKVDQRQKEESVKKEEIPAPKPKKEFKNPQPPVRTTPEEKAVAKLPQKAAAKSRATTYTRTTELHKKLLSELLDSAHPTWRANPTKAKEASLKMEGMPFLDDSGKILDSFKEELKKEMA